MNSTLKMILLVIVGIAIGYGARWWMDCRHEAKEKCEMHGKGDDKDKDCKDKKHDKDKCCKHGKDSNVVNWLDGEHPDQNGVVVTDMPKMWNAITYYQTNPLPPSTPTGSGSWGGSFSVETLQDMIDAISNNGLDTKFKNIYFRLGASSTSRFPQVYFFGRQTFGFFGVTSATGAVTGGTSTPYGLCPTFCDLPSQ